MPPHPNVADRLKKLVGLKNRDEPEATVLTREILTPDDSQLKDPRLIALLSNASFMNGSSKGKPSIWSILQKIHRTPPNRSTLPHDDSESQPLNEEHQPAPSDIYQNQLDESSIFSDTSSIMVYSPLFPTQSDVIELAELVPVDDESGETEAPDTIVGDSDVSRDMGGNVPGDDTLDIVGGAISSTWIWPFSTWYGQSQSQQPPVGTSNNNTDTGPSTPRIRPVKSQKSIHAWVPSSSKLSVQAFWWGYRLYLPPPILEILSDKTLEATKRSAMITTALTWFASNLPVQSFPPPIQPGIIVLQRLVPFLSYIGTLISWSWSTIKSYDVGYGVTLTATWILPVALIPGTWYERDFPKSPIPNTPVPLPRSPPFPMQSFVPPTPSTTTDDIPTSAYVTPMSSMELSSLLHSLNGATLDERNGMLDPSSTSSTVWSPSAQPLQLPISSPTYHPTTILPNSPNNNLGLTPNLPTPVIALQSPPTPTLTLPVTPLLFKPSSTPSSPRIRIPRFGSRMKSSSPSINNNNSNDTTTTTPPLNNNNNIPPYPYLSPTTPIPIPSTPIELPPIPPELPLSPKLVNQLLLGPVLQIVPLPDVDSNGGR